MSAIFHQLFLVLITMGSSLSTNTYPPPCVMGKESLMSKKAHGTSPVPVQENLRWDVDRKVADRICNFNRHYAEHSGYWTSSTHKFLKDILGEGGKPSDYVGGPITFYDSNTGKPLFVAPKGRSFEEFFKESKAQ